MRISDWSSDVCSSDLHDLVGDLAQDEAVVGPVEVAGDVDGCADVDLAGTERLRERGAGRLDVVGAAQADGDDGRAGAQGAAGSEERRVGEECASTCRSRWATDHEKKKQQ